jgi:clan AA aspartic protease
MLLPVRKPLPQGEIKMGLTHVAVHVRNLTSKDSFTEDFLVDTGAWNSFAPTNMLKRIGIEPIGRTEFELANGQLEEYEYGIAEMEFLDEIIATRIIFGPDRTEPLLGVVALETAGFIVDPQHQTLRKLSIFPLKLAISARIAIPS